MKIKEITEYLRSERIAFFKIYHYIDHLITENSFLSIKGLNNITITIRFFPDCEIKSIEISNEDFKNSRIKTMDIFDKYKCYIFEYTGGDSISNDGLNKLLKTFKVELDSSLPYDYQVIKNYNVLMKTIEDSNGSIEHKAYSQIMLPDNRSLYVFANDKADNKIFKLVFSKQFFHRSESYDAYDSITDRLINNLYYSLIIYKPDSKVTTVDTSYIG